MQFVSLKTLSSMLFRFSYSVTEENMKAYFEAFGELTFSQLKKKADGTSRGYGFIRFKDYEDQVSEGRR